MIVAVILGNRMNDNGTLSALARKRLDLAEKLYKEYSPEEIILSGGRANPNVDVTEADAMLKELKRRGNIDESVILLEGKSLSTKETRNIPCRWRLNSTPIRLSCAPRANTQRDLISIRSDFSVARSKTTEATCPLKFIQTTNNIFGDIICLKSKATS